MDNKNKKDLFQFPKAKLFVFIGLSLGVLAGYIALVEGDQAITAHPESYRDFTLAVGAPIGAIVLGSLIASKIWKSYPWIVLTIFSTVAFIISLLIFTIYPIVKNLF